MQNIAEAEAASVEPEAPAATGVASDAGQQEPARRKQVRSAPDRAADIIDTATLCERLGKSRGTIDAWRRDGLIPYIQLGRSIMYSWSSVLEALKRAERRGE